jgi:hypothetical protein
LSNLNENLIKIEILSPGIEFQRKKAEKIDRPDLDELRGLDEVDAVCIVLLHARAEREYIRVKDDVIPVEANFIH